MLGWKKRKEGKASRSQHSTLITPLSLPEPGCTVTGAPVLHIPCWVFISHAHFWLFLPVTVSRDDMEKPFVAQVPLASVGLAEVWSLAQGDRVIILVRQITLCNTYFWVYATGNDSQLVQRRGKETWLHNINNSTDVKGAQRERKDSSKVLTLSLLVFCCCFHYILLKGKARRTEES